MVGLRMRAVRSDGFLLDSDSKPALDTLTNSRIPTRFRVTDKAGLPCFRHSYEDRALRTPDIRSPGRGRKSHEILARPDIVVLHVDPPPGVFDDGLEKVAGLPVVLGGKLVAPAGISEGKTAMFEAGGAGDLRLDQATGLGTPPVHDIAHLYFDGTLVVGANTQMQLENFAVRRIVLEAGARLVFEERNMRRDQHTECNRTCGAGICNGDGRGPLQDGVGQRLHLWEFEVFARRQTRMYPL